MSKTSAKALNALFTKSQQQVLLLIYGNVEESYYLNEIVRTANMGKGTIMRELDKLLEAGLISKKKQGKQNHYSASKKAPFYDELKSIFGQDEIKTPAKTPAPKAQTETKTIAKAEAPIEKKPQATPKEKAPAPLPKTSQKVDDQPRFIQQLMKGLESIAQEVDIAYIYGSIDRLDLDLLIVSENLWYSELMDLLAPLEQKLAKRINPRIYTAEKYAEKIQDPKHFLYTVHQEQKILLIGDAS